MKKYLILRLSSFGDVAQCLPTAQALAATTEKCEVHWLIRSDLKALPSAATAIHKVWTLDRKMGVKGLIQICQLLAKEKFTHVYDAHNNLRSTFIRLFLFASRPQTRFAVRSKNRWRRFLLFKLRINTFPNPFLGVRSFLSPIQKWSNKITTLPVVELRAAQTNIFMRITEIKPDKYIAIAPSAAWGLKTWPIRHWIELIHLISEQCEKIAILGGPTDSCCAEISKSHPNKVVNLAGKVSWEETIAIIQNSKILISGDTGALHFADIIQKPAIALVGPTAFGFPSSPKTKTLQVALSCRPCTKDGRGKCTNSVHQRCLSEITPAMVANQFSAMIGKEIKPKDSSSL